MDPTPANRILHAWTELEAALRAALPVCSVAPPTQPTELLSALRITRLLGEEEERLILELREIRNRVAHSPEEPPEGDADRFEEEALRIVAYLATGDARGC